MMATDEVRQIIDDLFEEEALLIGGLAATHRLEDNLVWRLVKNLDVIRARFLRRIEARDTDGHETATARRYLTPHPAIEDFLMSIRRTRA